jgi:uncharacterized protein YjbI with pentapeptide repeats
MTLGLGAGGSQAISEVAIEDSGGTVALRSSPGQQAASATLSPGEYTVVFTASPSLTAPQTLFLKLADTASQATRRLQASTQSGGSTGGLLGAPPPSTALGQVSSNQCFNCDFDGADLSNQDFTDNFLGGSTFNGTTMTNTNFTRVYCYQCQISNVGAVGSLNFTDAILDSATVCCQFAGVNFTGTMMINASLHADFTYANFGPSTTRSTTMAGADVRLAFFQHANVRHVDFTGAKLEGDLQFYDFINFFPSGDDLVGVIFDNVTPANPFTHMNFAGMDLTGGSFAGVDMSGADLSVASGTKVTGTGLAKAKLSNGTTGAKMGGVDFGTAFTGWAGSADGTTPGTDLRGVDLTGANLYEADLTGVNLSNAVLVGADLSNSSLRRATLAGAQLGVTPDNGIAAAANLSGAYMPLADFSDADLRSVKFDGAHVYGEVKFVRARLDSASLIGTNLADADFTQASLSNANFTQAILVGAVFSGANLQNSNMDKSYVQGASFTNTASVAGLSLFDAYVSLTEGAWGFKEADGTPYSVGYGATTIGDLGTSAKGIVVCPSGQNGPCTSDKLQPSSGVPYPPPPPAACIPVGPDYDNCLPASN